MDVQVPEHADLLSVARTYALKPLHYELRIEPDLEKCRFEGAVTIEIEVLRNSAAIVVNVQNLLIHSTILYGEEGTTISLFSTKADPSSQAFIVTPASETALHHGARVFLHQAFSGNIRKDESCKGFFLSPSPPNSNPSTNTRLNPIASTSLEPTYARTLFPCFDDPSLKATFSLTLILPTHLTALSNNSLKSSKPEREVGISTLISPKQALEFETTPLLPTYLLSFVIGNFNCISNDSFRFPICAYAPAGAEYGYEIETARSTLEFAAKALAVLERDLGIDCGLTKLDFVAIPGSAGGMENWGLITLNSMALCITSQHSADDKLEGMKLVAHELAHQYFGNLVTMKSWDCFWLKEGMAEWLEHHVRERLGDSETVAEGVSEGFAKAMKIDESRFTHALERQVAGKKGVGEGLWREMYDDVTYKKGYAVLRMLEVEIGRDVFLQGARSILKEHIHGNSSPDEFWDVLSRLTGKDIKAMMQIWTRNAGYPVVEVVEDEVAGTITVNQNRFFKGGREKMEVDLVSYPLPVNVLTPTGVVKGILDDKLKILQVSPECYKLNAGQTGFYRVAYSAARLRVLGTDLCREVMSVEDRIGLVSDTAAAAFAGHGNIRTSDLFSLLQNFEDETSYFVWRVIISTLREISKSFVFEERLLRDAFEQFWRHLVGRCLYRNASFSTYDDLNEQKFKALMFGNSGRDKKVIAAAFAMFASWTGVETNVINPNIRAEVFEIVLRNGGKKEVSGIPHSCISDLRIQYRKLVHCLETAKDPVRRDILSSLGHTRDYGSLKETLKRATSLELILNSEMVMTLKPLTTHKKGIWILWRFLATGAWSKNPALNIERIAPISQMVLNSCTKMRQCEGAKKHMKGYDTSVCLLPRRRCAC